MALQVVAPREPAARAWKAAIGLRPVEVPSGSSPERTPLSRASAAGTEAAPPLLPPPRVAVKVEDGEGEEVQPGQPLATVEAMKMENILRAEKQAVVSKIVGHMAEAWLDALQWVMGDEERDQAFRGLVMLATQEPLWQHLDEVRGGWGGGTSRQVLRLENSYRRYR